MLDNGTKQTHYNTEKTLMDLQKLMPQQAQPISRITNGQLPTELSELSEEILGAAEISTGDTRSTSILASADMQDESGSYNTSYCSYEGDDAE
jgi:bacteriocin leader peptide (microcyclamide/patellamide family)